MEKIKCNCGCIIEVKGNFVLLSGHNGEAVEAIHCNDCAQRFDRSPKKAINLDDNPKYYVKE